MRIFNIIWRMQAKYFVNYLLNNLSLVDWLSHFISFMSQLMLNLVHIIDYMLKTLSKKILSKKIISKNFLSNKLLSNNFFIFTIRKTLIKTCEKACLTRSTIGNTFKAAPIVVKSNESSNKPNGVIEAIYKFVSIWDFEQWFWSLLVLVLLYLFATWIHNKYVAPRIGLYISQRMTAYLISFDLFFNFILGIYYMYYRDTAFGQFMVQCPVAVSPFIFLFEIIAMTIIFIVKERAKKSDTHPNA